MANYLVIIFNILSIWIWITLTYKLNWLTDFLLEKNFNKYKNKLITYLKNFVFKAKHNVIIRKHITFYYRKYYYTICVSGCILIANQLKTIYFFFFISRFLFLLSSFQILSTYSNQIYFFEILILNIIKPIFLLQIFFQLNKTSVKKNSQIFQYIIRSYKIKKQVLQIFLLLFRPK